MSRRAARTASVATQEGAARGEQKGVVVAVADAQAQEMVAAAEVVAGD